MEAQDLEEIVQDMRHQVIDDLVDQHMPPKSYADQWDTVGLKADLVDKVGITVPVVEWAASYCLSRRCWYQPRPLHRRERPNNGIRQPGVGFSYRCGRLAKRDYRRGYWVWGK